MGVLFFDGFESGWIGPWEYLGQNSPSYIDVQNGTVKKGSYSLYLTGQFGYLGKVLAASTNNVYFRFWFRVAGVNGAMGNDILTVFYGNDLTGDQFSLGIQTDRKLATCRGVWYPNHYFGYSVTTAADALSLDTWYLIEGWFYIDNSAGRAVIKVDGDTVIDYTGDTQHNASQGISSFQIGSSGYVYYGSLYFDDFVISDDDWLPTNIGTEVLVPTGAGTTTQWTPSTGSNYACVDEIPPTNTENIATNTSNNVDTYAAGNLVNSGNAALAVMVQAQAVKNGTPTPTKLQAVLRSGGTDYTGSSSLALLTTTRTYGSLWTANPAGGSWDDSSINAIEIGVKAVA